MYEKPIIRETRSITLDEFKRWVSHEEFWVDLFTRKGGALFNGVLFERAQTTGRS